MPRVLFWPRSADFQTSGEVCYCCPEQPGQTAELEKWTREMLRSDPFLAIVSGCVLVGPRSFGWFIKVGTPSDCGPSNNRGLQRQCVA